MLEPYIKQGVHSWTGEQLAELGYDNFEAFQAFSEILDAIRVRRAATRKI